MNLDDESHLSAYLDDELDPPDRLAVEWSLESSPPLSDQLRSLALARDVVASLDRPPIPLDLAPILTARITAKRRSDRIRSLVRPVRIAFALSSFSAVAACLIFALILLNHSLHDPIDQPKVTKQIDQDSTTRRNLDSNPEIAPSPSLAGRQLQVVPEIALAPSTGPSIALNPPVESGVPGESKELGNRHKITQILERPHVRRIVIVTDVIDASEKIRDLIQQDARKYPEFGRITICQDIVIDSGRVEAAEVFAVPMEERGRRSFVEKLSRQFPNLIEEGELRPDLLTELSEVGQVAIFRGTEAAPLIDPPVDLHPFIANRANNPAELIVPGRGLEDANLNERVDPSLVERTPPYETSPASTSKANTLRADFVGPPAPRREPPLKPGDPVTLLVWITHPKHH